MIKAVVFKVTLAGLAAAVLVPGFFTGRASASFGLSNYHGYFYNQFDSSGDIVLSSGLYANNIDELVGTIGGYLGDSRNGAGAAFIVLTMLGYPAGTDPSVASTQFGAWEALVRDYDGAGRVNYNVFQSYNANTFYQDDHNDIAAYDSFSSAFSIVFTRPDGSLYKIKRDCGNPLDDIRELPELNSRVQGFRVGPGNTSLGPYGDTTLGGVGTTGANPYVFNNVPTGGRGFNSTAYIDIGTDLYRLIGYSLCYNDSSCHGSITDSGLATTVDPPPGGYADIWSHYEKDEPVVSVGVFNVTCNEVTGRFRDPNNAAVATRVRLYIDGVLVSETLQSQDPSAFSLPINSYRSLVDRSVRVDVESVWADGSGTGRFYTVGSGTLSSGCVSVSCGGYNPSGNQEVGVPFNLQVQINIASLGSNARGVSQTNGYRFNIRIIRPNGTPMNINNVPFSDIPPPSGNVTVTASQNGVTFSEPGNYTITWQFAGPSPLLPVNCNLAPPAVIEVVSKPYILAHGNDVVAGGGVHVNPAVCTNAPITAMSNKRIRGFNKSGPFAGSGVQYAAMTMGEIRGFNSAARRGTNPVADRGLSLANTGAQPGDFSHTRCIPDYFGGILNTSEVSVTRHSGAYVVSSNETLSTPGYPSGVGYKIIDGDLFIDHSVNLLEGVYIAKRIYTCSLGAALIDLTNLYTVCNKQLVINGALIATDKLYLLRTHGSLVDAVGQEGHGSAPRQCVNPTPPPAKAVCASEYINFNPAIYTAPGPIKRPLGTRYDAFLGLPPIL